MQPILSGILATQCLSLLMEKHFALFSIVLEIFRKKAVESSRLPLSYIKLVKTSVSRGLINLNHDKNVFSWYSHLPLITEYNIYFCTFFLKRGQSCSHSFHHSAKNKGPLKIPKIVFFGVLFLKKKMLKETRFFINQKYEKIILRPWNCS